MSMGTENLIEAVGYRSQTQEVDRANMDLFARIFKVYEQASQTVKDVIETMASIINDPETEQEERLAAADTLWEALFPSKLHDGFGATLERLPLDSEGKTVVDKETEGKHERFSEKVRNLLKARRMTQSELATVIGVGQSAIAMMLSRECRPQKATVAKIAKALGVTPEELW